MNSVSPLHPWPTAEADALAIQAELAGRVDTSTPLARFETVAGCDVAYHTEAPLLFAAVVVLDAHLAVVEAANKAQAVMPV